jgi:hypothetical protein
MLMNFNEWQKWRSGAGRRPTKKKDGVSTTSKEEAQLWRATMEANHGDDWMVDLAALQAQVSEEEEAEDEEDGEEATTTGAAAGTGSLQASTTGEFLNPGAAARNASPGSGTYNTPRREAGGQVTPGSWRSDVPGSPGGLARTINTPFDPTQESLTHYENRLRRQVFALSAIGEAVPASRVDVLLTKARIVSGSPDRELLKHLKREYAMCLLEDDSEENLLSSAALEELLKERGFEPSEVRERILRGEAVSTPSPTKTTFGSAQVSRATAQAPGLFPKIAPFPDLTGAAIQSGLITPLASPEVDALRRRLEEMEVKQAALTVGGGPGFAEAMEAQTKALVASMARPQGSTIRVEPRVTWPKLGDDGIGGREVEEFYDKLEEIFGLANNGKGMSSKEMLVALKSCLVGSRRGIYDNIVKAKGTRGTVLSEELSKEIYDDVKERLMKFTETIMERQLRVRREWDALTKTRQMSALQFEAGWERILAELEESGLGKTEREKFLAYIEKLGSHLGEEIRKDRRPRPDGAGGTTTRDARTWEEAHFVVIELEGIKGGTKALSGIRSGGQGGQWDQSGWQDPDKGKGKGKGKGDGKGKGKG